MSKLKRKVTVDNQQSTQEEHDRRKPSVFERLGPGAAGASRKYDDNICRNFLAGKCFFGTKCRYSHVKRKQERDDDSSSDEYSKPGRSKSTVSRRESDGEEEMRSAKTELDFKKELELEKKRQQIERELKQLGAYEEIQNITIEKKVVSSSDDSSPERPHKKKKSPSKKKDKKKHKVKSPTKMKAVTPSPEKKVKKFEDPEKETGQKKKHKKKKSLEKKMADLSDEDIKPKKSKQKGGKSKTADQKPRLSFQSEEDEEDTIVVKKNRQRTPSESPSRSRSRSWSQEMSRQHSPDERYEERSPSPVQRKSKKGHKGVDHSDRRSSSPEARHPERRARSSSYESADDHSNRKKGKKESRKEKQRPESQYQSDSEDSVHSRDRSRDDKGKKHKKGRGGWSPESHEREPEVRYREPKKASPVDFRDHKSQKERDKHSPSFREHHGRSMSIGSRHTETRREMSPVSPRSGSQYHRERRMSPPDRREMDSRYDKRERSKDDPRRGGRFPSPDRRYEKIHHGDRPELDRGPDRFGDRREIHEERFEPPVRGEPPRGRFGDDRGFYDQRGRPENYDRYERDRGGYGGRGDTRDHPHRGGDPRDRGDPRIDPRGDPRYAEGVYDDRGPPPANFREPSWDRWQQPGPPEHFNRGGKGYNQGDRYRGSQRGGRFEIPPPPPPPERQSRRGDWERQGEFYVPERRDWGDRRDDGRDYSREDDRRGDRPNDKNRYDRRNEDRERSRDPRERYGEPRGESRGDPREGSLDRHDRKEPESYRSREFSSDRVRDVDKDISRKDRKISEPREVDKFEHKREHVEKEKKEVVEKLIEEKEPDRVEKEAEVKEGKKEKDKTEVKKVGEKEKKKRTKAEKKARKEEKLKAKQKKLEEKLAKEREKSDVSDKPPDDSAEVEQMVDSRKRSLSKERSKSVSPSPSSKRPREVSPAHSVHSRHSARSKVKEEPEVKSERSRPKSADSERDNISEKSMNRKTGRKPMEREQSPLEEIKDPKKKKRSWSPGREEEIKRRRTDDRDRVRKLRGSGDEEGGRFSDWTDDSADDILNQAEPQQPGSAIPEHVYRERGRQRRSRSRSSYGSRHSIHDSRSHRSESSRYRDKRSKSRNRSGERERRSRGEGDREREKDRERDKDKDYGRPKSESDTRVIPDQLEVKSEVRDDDIKSEVKQESGAESEDDLSLDSISSDEEFEAEHEKKQSIDALDIDWASLQQDVRPKAPVSGSALNRYKACNVFAQIGVSKEYAGEELFNKIQNECIKQEPDTENPPSEKQTEEDKTENKFKFKSNVAVFHSSITNRNKERQNLLRNIGPFRRALCARRDLDIRRQLCRVDKSIENVTTYQHPVIDNELYKLSVQLFRQSCKTSEKKEPVEATLKPEQIKQEVTCS